MTQTRELGSDLQKFTCDWGPKVRHGGAGTTAAGLKAAVKERAAELAITIAVEDGAVGAVKAFFKPRLPSPPSSPVGPGLPGNCFSPVRKCFGCS